MRLLLTLNLSLLVACLPTGTGNPLQDGGTPGRDAFAGQDVGGRFDAAASDSGPSYDAAADSGAGSDGGPASDGFAPDTGSCTDSGPPRCGTTGGPTCDCLAGDSVTLGEGRPILLVDHDALDGRVTLLRQRQDEMRGTTIEALVVSGDVLESTTELASNVQASAASSGDAISVAVVLGSRQLLHLIEVAPDTGVAMPPLVYVHPRPVGETDVARSGSTAAIAFASRASEDPLDGESVFVLRAADGVFDADVQQHIGGRNVRALAIAASGETWLLAVGTDDSVFTLVLDASGTAMGAAHEVSADVVTRLDLTARDGGFFLALDGTAPAIHALDATGVSVAQSPIVGRLLALEWSELGYGMTLRSDVLGCANVDSPLTFERFSADFTPLHDPVRIGVADYAAAVALVDGSPWVVSSTEMALSLTNACLDED